MVFCREQNSKSANGDEDCIILEIDGNSSEQVEKDSSAEKDEGIQASSNSDTEIIPVEEEVPENTSNIDEEPPRKKVRSRSKDLQENVASVTTTGDNQNPSDNAKMNVVHIDIQQQALLANMSQAIAANTSHLITNIPGHPVISVIPDPVYDAQNVTANLLAAGPSSQQQQPPPQQPFIPPLMSQAFMQPRVINIVPDEVQSVQAQQQSLQAQQMHQWSTFSPTGIVTIMPNQVSAMHNNHTIRSVSSKPAETSVKARDKGKRTSKPKKSTTSKNKEIIHLQPKASSDIKQKVSSNFNKIRNMLTTKTKTFEPYIPSFKLPTTKCASDSSDIIQTTTIDLMNEGVKNTVTTPKPGSLKPKNFLQVVFKSPANSSDDKADGKATGSQAKTLKMTSKKKNNKDNEAYTTKRKDEKTVDRRKSRRQKKNRKFDDCVVIADDTGNKEDEDDSDFESDDSLDSICHSCNSEEPPIEFEKGMDMNMFELKWVDCDQCHLWYHWFCVGIYDEDETKYFKCHTCKNK